jgi:hypothetical protein
MRYVIGLGTGRCGTASLAALLGAQEGVHVGHEQAPMIPWRPSSDDNERAVRWLEAQPGPVVGDVAHAWISLVPQLAAHASVQCVALWRPVGETAASFCRHMPAAYIQTNSLKGALQFPTYDLPERVAWRRYVTTYHNRMAGLSDCIEILPMEALNSQRGQRRILRAAGIPHQQHTYFDECHHNATTNA